jgi:3D (Asp-Asp-Asp) domain-containing protein
LDKPGEPILITHYNTTRESEHPLEESAWAEKANLLIGEEVRKVTIEFLTQLSVQGSGFLDSGTGEGYNGYVHWEGNNTASKQSCAVTASGACAETLKTGATSIKEEDRKATGMAIFRDGVGTKVYIENQSLEITINDVGGGVDRHQIDVYTGLEGSQEDVNFPGNSHSTVWGLIQEE